MNKEKLLDIYFTFSEYVVAYMINVFYVLLLITPLYFFDFFIKENIMNVAGMFIPLIALFGMALKSLTYAFYMIYLQGRLYYKPFFWKSLSNNFLITYLYYLAVSALLYFSVFAGINLSHKFGSVFIVFMWFSILVFTSNMIYSTIQFAIYEKIPILSLVKNSFILSLVFGLLSVAGVIVLVYLSYKMVTSPWWLATVALPIFSGVLIVIHKLIESKNFIRGNEEKQ